MYIDIVIHIFSGNIFKICIRCIWLNGKYVMPNFIAPYFNVTIPLFQHFVITNGTLYGVSYFYATWLLSMNLSPTLYLWSTIFIFLRILSLLIWVYFCWCIISQCTLCFIWIIVSQSNTNWPGLYHFNQFVVEIIVNAAAAKITDHGDMAHVN